MKNFFPIPALILTVAVVYLFSCSKDDGGGGGNNTVNCDTVNFTVSASASNVVPCSSAGNNGSIQVTASGSSGFTYSINNGAFQSVNVFSSLAAGTYNIVVKDVNNCTKSTTATVGTAQPGAQFTAMKNLIVSRCSGGGCHLNGQAGGGVNFDNECNIITRASQINNQCVTLSRMPPSGPLPANEKAIITNWISGGSGYSN